LSNLPDAGVESGIFIANVPNELLELLGLRPLEAGNTAMIDEGPEFVSDENEPVKIVVHRRETEHLFVQRLRVEAPEKCFGLSIPAFIDLITLLVCLLRQIEKLASRSGLVKRSRGKVLPLEVTELGNKAGVLAKTGHRFFIFRHNIDCLVELRLAPREILHRHAVTLRRLLSCGLLRLAALISGSEFGFPRRKLVDPFNLFLPILCHLIAKLRDAFDFLLCIRGALLSRGELPGVCAVRRESFARLFLDTRELFVAPNRGSRFVAVDRRPLLFASESRGVFSYSEVFIQRLQPHTKAFVHVGRFFL